RCVEELQRSGVEVAPEGLGPAGAELVAAESLVEAVVAGESQERQHDGKAFGRCGENVLVAEFEPSVGLDPLPGRLEGVDEDLPGQAGEERERLARRLPLLSVLLGQRPPVPGFRPPVTRPPSHLEPRVGDGPAATPEVAGATTW